MLNYITVDGKVLLALARRTFFYGIGISKVLWYPQALACVNKGKEDSHKGEKNYLKEMRVAATFKLRKTCWR